MIKISQAFSVTFSMLMKYGHTPGAVIPTSIRSRTSPVRTCHVLHVQELSSWRSAKWSSTFSMGGTQRHRLFARRVSSNGFYFLLWSQWCPSRHREILQVSNVSLPFPCLCFRHHNWHPYVIAFNTMMLKRRIWRFENIDDIKFAQAGNFLMNNLHLWSIFTFWLK